jgi:hypothetical protein
MLVEDEKGYTVALVKFDDPSGQIAMVSPLTSQLSFAPMKSASVKQAANP